MTQQTFHEIKTAAEASIPLESGGKYYWYIDCIDRRLFHCCGLYARTSINFATLEGAIKWRTDALAMLLLNYVER